MTKTFNDANGKNIQVSYFGNLDEKLKIATGYCRAINSMRSDANMPLIDMDNMIKGIHKAHDKFYGNTSKYDGQGCLKGA